MLIFNHSILLQHDMMSVLRLSLNIYAVLLYPCTHAKPHAVSVIFNHYHLDVDSKELGQAITPRPIYKEPSFNYDMTKGVHAKFLTLSLQIVC